MRTLLFLLLITIFLIPLENALAESEAEQILRSVHERDRGDDLIWKVAIDLTDRNGHERQRTGKIFRRELAGERSEQVTVFLSPANIRHTALLEVEAENGDEYMWLYLPALRFTKRVPPADRSDKFVGTDFTMEDVSLGFKYRDYHGTILAREMDQAHPVVVMRVEPKTSRLKRELGFDYSIAKIRTDQSIFIEQRFFQRGREIRHNQALDIQSIDGILTPMELRSADLINNHRTVMRVVEVTYNSGLPTSYFRKQSLARRMYR